MSEVKISKLAETLRNLDRADGYYCFSNKLFDGYSEFEIAVAAKRAEKTVQWMEYEQEAVVIL